MVIRTGVVVLVELTLALSSFNHAHCVAFMDGLSAIFDFDSAGRVAPGGGGVQYKP